MWVQNVQSKMWSGVSVVDSSGTTIKVIYLVKMYKNNKLVSRSDNSAMKKIQKHFKDESGKIKLRRKKKRKKRKIMMNY